MTWRVLRGWTLESVTQVHTADSKRRSVLDAPFLEPPRSRNVLWHRRRSPRLLAIGITKASVRLPDHHAIVPEGSDGPAGARDIVIARRGSSMYLIKRATGRIAPASKPLAAASGTPRFDSTFGGVEIGAVTRSFNRIANPDPQAIINAHVEIGLGESALLADHSEALAGAPPMPVFGRFGGGHSRPQLTPEQLAERNTRRAQGGTRETRGVAHHRQPEQLEERCQEVRRCRYRTCAALLQHA